MQVTLDKKKVTDGNGNILVYPCTMGDALFTECSELCRVSKHGHSAKRQFAECRTRQSRPSAKSIFAECQTLGKEGHSANVLFAECQTLGKE